VSDSNHLQISSEIDGPSSAASWILRLSGRWALETGTRARLIKAACKAASKTRDSVRLAIAAKRAPWSVAWAPRCPAEDAAIPVWAYGQLLRIMAELAALPDEPSAEDARDYRERISGLEVAATALPDEAKVEAEQELRGERQIDRRVHGPDPVPRHRSGGGRMSCRCIRV
jgi:hypothetical protein